MARLLSAGGSLSGTIARFQGCSPPTHEDEDLDSFDTHGLALARQNCASVYVTALEQDRRSASRCPNAVEEDVCVFVFTPQRRRQGAAHGGRQRGSELEGDKQARAQHRVSSASTFPEGE
jgi:hypothetical protein